MITYFSNHSCVLVYGVGSSHDFATSSVIYTHLHCLRFLWEREVVVPAGMLGTWPIACLAQLLSCVQGLWQVRIIVFLASVGI